MAGAPVADEDVTIRLVTAQQWKDGRPTSAVFKGNWPLSVWVQSRLSTLDGLRRGSFADCGFVGLLASTIRGIPESEEAKLDIVYAPEGATQEFEDLAGAHAHITSLLGGRLRSGQNPERRYLYRLDWTKSRPDWRTAVCDQILGRVPFLEMVGDRGL